MTRILAVPLLAPGRKESSWIGISYCSALIHKVLSGLFIEIAVHNPPAWKGV